MRTKLMLDNAIEKLASVVITLKSHRRASTDPVQGVGREQVAANMRLL